MRSLLFALLGVAGQVSAHATVISFANGGDLAGGTMEVYFSDGTSSQGTFAVKPGNPAAAILGTLTSPFYFEVAGSTYDNPWLLRNQTASLLITGFQINLASTLSAFDAQGASNLVTTPLHAGSDFTKLPALLSGPTGITIGGYTFANQYDPAGGRNAFRTLTVTLGGNGLAAGQSLMFQADTDLATSAVPEPEPLTLLGVGLILLGWRRSRG